MRSHGVPQEGSADSSFKEASPSCPSPGFHFTFVSHGFPIGNAEGVAELSSLGLLGRGSDSESTGVGKKVTPYQPMPKVWLKVRAHSINSQPLHPSQGSPVHPLPHLLTSLYYSF